ncbi:MAG TPA: hypothetical protein VGF38_05900 [Ktedonobacterales bacterium]|jgi:hypothetical protein
MDLFMTISGALVIALILGLGIWLVIYSVRLLRRGDEVTTEEAVKWRRGALKRGFYASPEMNPAITDILVRAWRSANGWAMLGSGVGVIVGGVFGAIYFVLSARSSITDITDGQAFLVAAVGSMFTVVPFGLVGMIMSLRRIKREPRNATQHPAIPQRVYGYRTRYVTLYMVAVIVGDLVLMSLLVVRLAPGFDLASLSSAFALPYLWLAPVAPAILLIAAITVQLVARWAATLPSLDLPQDEEVRQRADRYLRAWAVRRSYSFFQYAAFAVVMAQFFFLELGFSAFSGSALLFSPSPLARTGLDIWFLGLFVLVAIGGIPLSLSLVPAVQSPGPLYAPWPDAPGHV